MSDVEVSGVTAGYGRQPVLHEIDLRVPTGTTTAVLGDSGSGKSTLLKVIAGFVAPIGGSVAIGGRTVVGPGVHVAPERRGVGYVRQDGGLFPHLTVAGNVAFGLPFPRRRHRPKVLELLDLVGLPAEMADRTPDQLSGGQQQRVALARALALEPSVVLLDEPFSALDTALREATREATGKALRAARATALLVTHDQQEALSFADEVAILRDGRFRQVAAPRVAYESPADAHVAGSLGDAVLLPGESSGRSVNSPLGEFPLAEEVRAGGCQVLFRPEQLAVGPAGAGMFDAEVGRVVYFGHDALVELDHLDPRTQILVRVRARVLGSGASLTRGERVSVRVLGPVRAFPL
ncbi:iron(III) transport system ATP-binding protein [Barrientosiimonas humi]|uniref:ABC-type quaternary amine transporter n=1 Tax=Barrientosiimonas humi TaxID=999931 RepID=A0A542XF57_9MICO|nr:ABC transporter ATP-binding protein [Barrientosiimonas humi]TQL34448.1 iron(III) transport system ATP-binding protein [Barrientosiimonas humi]CAG7574437.1 Fe(3+) ions import ATP-binding protein FbpC 2 [Barrientosiimonas humi]